ncbi:MAG: hypothetical protein HQK53_01325 [Oligoflexia bacterium]|nr:hypothetical protein [Oligoflexia bacterium]
MRILNISRVSTIIFFAINFLLSSCGGSGKDGKDANGDKYSNDSKSGKYGKNDNQDIVYAGGYNMSGISVTPGYWKNGAWTPLPRLGEGYQSAEVTSLVVLKSDVYAGGYSNDGEFDVPGYWVNGIWNPLPKMNPESDSWVTSLVVSNSVIYAGGYIHGDHRGNPNRRDPGYWVNGIWNALPKISAKCDSSVTSLVVVGSDVYAGGQQCEIPDNYADYNNPYSPPRQPPPVHLNLPLPSPTPTPPPPPLSCFVGYWKNQEWNSIFSANTAVFDSRSLGLTSLVVSSSTDSTDDVYAGGYIYDYSEGRKPGYWKNKTWNPLQNPLGYNLEYDSTVTSLIVSGSNVYAGGQINDSTIKRINVGGPMTIQKLIPGYWINGIWHALPTNSKSKNSEYIKNSHVKSLAVSGSNIYVGGDISFSPGYWKNSVWEALTVNGQQASGVVNTLVVTQN